VTLLSDEPIPLPRSRTRYTLPACTWFLLTCCGVALVLFLRSRNAILSPGMLVEDGTVFLAPFHNHPSWRNLLHHYAGFIPLFPNLTTVCALGLCPLRWTPYFMMGTSFLLAVLALSCFSLRRFRVYLPNDGARAMICGLVALLPLGNHLVLTNVSYCIWHLLYFALLLYLGPPPTSRWQILFLLGTVTLAVCSNPLSIVLGPIALYRLSAAPTLSEKLTSAYVFTLVCGYLIRGTAFQELTLSFSFSTVETIANYLVSRVGLEALLGGQLRYDLFSSCLPRSCLFLALLCGILGSAALAARSRRCSGKTAPLLPWVLWGYFLVAMTTASVLGRSLQCEEKLATPWDNRYFYIQQLMLLTGSGILLARSWVSWGRLIKVTSLVCVPILIVPLNLYNHTLFSTTRAEGEVLEAFLRSAEVRLSRCGDLADREGLTIVLEREGPWDIVLRCPRSSRPRH